MSDQSAMGGREASREQQDNERGRRRVLTECISWRWHGNLGDDMIFAAQEAMFGQILELGQYVSEARAVLVGGGTFVPKSPEHPDLVRLSRTLPTAFFGTGIGDPLFWGTDHISEWLEVIENARFVGVRGPLSRERLGAWGVSLDRIEWIGDPGLYFARNELASRGVEGRLAVNLGITYGKLYGFDEERLTKTVVLALRELIRAGWDITLVCAWQPDDGILERIKAEVPLSGVEHWHENYERALESIGKFDVVLAEKLHIGVVAACRSVPFVALSYRSKVMDFCQSIGWEKFCINTENAEPKSIVELISTLARGREEYASYLRDKTFRVRERLLKAVPQVIAVLTDDR